MKLIARAGDEINEMRIQIFPHDESPLLWAR